MWSCNCQLYAHMLYQYQPNGNYNLHTKQTCTYFIFYDKKYIIVIPTNWYAFILIVLYISRINELIAKFAIHVSYDYLNFHNNLKNSVATFSSIPVIFLFNYAFTDICLPEFILNGFTEKRCSFPSKKMIK